MASAIAKALMAAMKAALPIINKAGEQDISIQRKAMDAIDLLIKPVKGTTFGPVSAYGVSCEYIIPQKISLPGKIIMHFHGGAYVTGSLKYARILASEIAAASGACVITVDYRLAPENPYPAALEDAVNVYRFLLEREFNANDIAMTGESAGGNLCLATMLKLKDAGQPLPKSMVCMSPWADLTGTSATYFANAKIDPMIVPESLLESAKAYAGDTSLDDPLVSPVFGDFSGFPPTMLLAGTNECLLDDTRTVHRKLVKAGVETELEIAQDMCHVYPIMGLKESKEAIKKIGAFLRRNFKAGDENITAGSRN